MHKCQNKDEDNEACTAGKRLSKPLREILSRGLPHAEEGTAECRGAGEGTVQHTDDGRRAGRQRGGEVAPTLSALASAEVKADRFCTGISVSNLAPIQVRDRDRRIAIYSGKCDSKDMSMEPLQMLKNEGDAPKCDTERAGRSKEVKIGERKKRVSGRGMKNDRQICQLLLGKGWEGCLLLVWHYIHFSLSVCVHLHCNHHNL